MGLAVKPGCGCITVTQWGEANEVREGHVTGCIRVGADMLQ